MCTTKEQVLTFLNKCEEIKKCKFIMATTKIKDLLKCIVNSPDLYRLFDTVTKNFDYPSNKANCLITENDGILNKSYINLPKTVGHRLAFIFCILVEFDRDTLNFNEFLKTYFYEDGSYFASYQAFCKVIISGLEELLKQVFNEQLNAAEDETPALKPSINSERANLFSAIILAIEEEKQYIAQRNISKDEKENAYKILNALINAVKDGKEEQIDALITGYNYFVLTNRCVSDGIAPLIETLAEYEELI